jgi:proteasome assembly chaperone (PAC2) family protein
MVVSRVPRVKAARIATSTRIPESTKCAGIRLRGFEGGGGIGGVSGIRVASTGPPHHVEKYTCSG